MKRILFILLCLSSFPCVASHIVGGEFQIRYIRRLNASSFCHDSGGDLDSVKLILYFDKKNGEKGAKDLFIRAAIYRKRDNAFMQFVEFGAPVVSKVNYTQPTCSKGEIQTDRLVYSTIKTFCDDQYNDPEGYYIIWERCCRNYSITNIYSNDPKNGGISAGQTFYLEFPPVVKNGKPFINSSPRLFPPLNDYACPRKLYYVDFKGVDDDGDSLTYTLVTPLSTHTFDALPPLKPRPYPKITWKNPFSLNNIIGGIPDLKISVDGFLTATPTKLGLYVFAVRCDEFRDGIKIGEVRRDFQMLVVDNCPRAEPPNIKGRKLKEINFSYDTTMIIGFSDTVTNANRCIEVQVSDPDALKEDDKFTENVTIKAISLNFKKDIREILPAITSATLKNGSTKIFKICFDACPYIEDGPFQIGIVAYDDACSLPLSDTLKITVNIDPPDNTNVRFTTTNVTRALEEGTTAETFPIRGVDDDRDTIIVAVFTDGFNLADAGMELKQKNNADGEYVAELVWDPRCDVYDFTHRTDFEVKILIEDVDYCEFSHPDTMVFKLHIILPEENDPLIDSDLTMSNNERRVEAPPRKVNESLIFNVLGSDIDKDFLILSASGKGFNIADYDVSFPTTEGNENVSSQFQWNINCDNVDLNLKDEFEFEFIVVDNANKCRFYKADTLNVLVKLQPPDNAKPSLLITSVNPDVPLVADSISIVLGQQIALGLVGADLDFLPIKDLVRIELLEATGNVTPTGYIFAAAQGRGNVNTTFAWKPDCSVFENGIYKNKYNFTFRVIDDRCFNAKGDTIKIAIAVRDIESNEADFKPPNFISPNGDKWNEFFAMVKEDPDTKELVSILPIDNCAGRFVAITIYNRWGKPVYESTNRDFRWYAKSESPGEYFYLLKYSNKDYKGIITVRD